MKRIFLIILISLFLILLLITPKSSTTTLHLPTKDISLIIADTTETREKGLSGKEVLPEDTAMLFIFDRPAQYGFWMKDMKFPIDILWLDENYQIVDMKKGLSPETFPETYEPAEKSLYVLETNANFVEENRLKVGDRLDIDLKK